MDAGGSATRQRSLSWTLARLANQSDTLGSTQLANQSDTLGSARLAIQSARSKQIMASIAMHSACFAIRLARAALKLARLGWLAIHSWPGL